MSKKVIVVDDSRTSRVLIRSTLTSAGYEVVEAEDGHDGLAKIADHRDAALVLCDVNMPKMGGLDMIREAREKHGCSGMTFIMLTTEAAPDLVQRAKATGAKGWIVKPFRPDLLLLAVRKLTAVAA